MVPSPTIVVVAFGECIAHSLWRQGRGPGGAPLFCASPARFSLIVSVVLGFIRSLPGLGGGQGAFNGLGIGRGKTTPTGDEFHTKKTRGSDSGVTIIVLVAVREPKVLYARSHTVVAVEASGLLGEGPVAFSRKWRAGYVRVMSILEGSS